MLLLIEVKSLISMKFRKFKGLSQISTFLKQHDKPDRSPQVFSLFNMSVPQRDLSKPLNVKRSTGECFASLPLLSLLGPLWPLLCSQLCSQTSKVPLTCYVEFKEQLIAEFAARVPYLQNSKTVSTVNRFIPLSKSEAR